MNIEGFFLWKSDEVEWKYCFWFLSSFFLHIQDPVLFLYFAATVFNIRDATVVGVDQAFVLADFVASDYFYFDHFVVLWKRKIFYIM